MKQRVTACIFDLDNTLFDWVAMWHAMFSTKLNEVARISGISIDTLKPEFRAIHQHYGTSEYPFALSALPSLLAKHRDADIRELYDSAMHAYYSARKRTLTPYPNVRETLEFLRGRGVKTIAYTESLAFYSAQRLKDMDLDLLLDVLYSPADHQLPNNLEPEELRQYPSEHYELRGTVHRHTPRGELKPNPGILRQILADAGVEAGDAIYVGDSPLKDIAMANKVGVTSVWAKYGYAVKRPEYPLLREVSHWTDADVQREKDLAEGNGISDADQLPKFTLEKDISELLPLFDFGAPQ